MNSLKIPDMGLPLKSSGEEASNLPQAFLISLEDGVIDRMIRYANAGGEIRIDMGTTPTLRYGPDAHPVAAPSDSLPYDLYLTRPFESTKSAVRVPHTGSLFQKPRNTKSSPIKSRTGRAVEGAKASDRSKGSSSSGLESDVEILQNGLAAAEESRARTKFVDKALPGKRGTTKLKGSAFSAKSPNAGSLPDSPALRGTSPSSTPVLSASHQARERAKERRMALVHELAVKNQTEDYLMSLWDGHKEEFHQVLKKIADFQSQEGTYKLEKSRFRELDVWNYDYDTQEQRQTAIDNAIRQFDRLRLSSSEPEWQKLLPMEERNKGICLSRLQTTIAKGPAQPAPKIKVQKADDSSSRDGDSEVADDGTFKRNGESAKSSSSSLPSKVKKPTSGDAQAKRLLSQPKAKAPATKPSPTKGKTSKAGDGRILSQEIIVDSDSSGDEALAVKPKAPPVKAKAKAPEAPKPRPSDRETVKPAPAKRPREDEDSSSSSGTPLVKRMKARQSAPPLKAQQQPPPQPAPRAAAKTKAPVNGKDTSPRKSSPLALSPPTNVSDMDDEDTPPPVPPPQRRRPEMESKNPLAKRKRGLAMSDELMNLTKRFKQTHANYVRLHHRAQSQASPPQSEIDQLHRMHATLEKMKRRIYGALDGE